MLREREREICLIGTIRVIIHGNRKMKEEEREYRYYGNRIMKKKKKEGNIGSYADKGGET